MVRVVACVCINSSYIQHTNRTRDTPFRDGGARKATRRRRIMSRAPGRLTHSLREPRERRLELAQEGRVADVLEAEAPAADRRAVTIEEHPRGEVPIYRSAGQCFDDGPPYRMRVRAAHLRLGHRCAAVLAVRRKTVARYECGDLVRG